VLQLSDNSNTPRNLKPIHSKAHAGIALWLAALSLFGIHARADGPLAPGSPEPAATAQPASIPPNGPPADSAGLFDVSQWSVHTQATVIEQWHYGFPSPYEGPNSFMSGAESDYTFSASLFLGHRLWTGAGIYYDPEFFQGHGLSDTLGIAGFPNGEAIKSGFPHVHYNTSRLFLRQTFGFGGGTEKIEDDADQLAGEEDINRLTLTVGKFAANDYFDDNADSHDARTQFLNWALLESGAWDAPGDVRGFTVGGVAEWHTQGGALRYGIFMEPRETNSASLDPHITRAFGQILEYDLPYKLGGGLTGTLRPFVYWNRANMGSFSVADALPSGPDISATRTYRSKEGLGLSWDQGLTANLSVFARLSWNDARTEEIAYSEIDRSAASGLSLAGSGWGRKDDVAGLAVAIDGLAPDHQQYLAAGGTGFILGDGGLNYGPEEILESYYSFQVTKWFSLSPDFQYIEHPGYNRDRGGVSVYAVRAHVEF
jgi:high affinity Mn2+ porin